MDNSHIITLQDFYERSERRMRISVDIDSKKGDNLKPLKTFFNLRYLFPNCKVSQDRTRHGFHVKAVGKEIEAIVIEKRVDIREALLDDPLRVQYDRLKIRWSIPSLTDVLFSMKRGFDGILSIVDKDVNPVALPWISRLPAKK